MDHIDSRPCIVDRNFSNHTLGACFNLYIDRFSLKTILGEGVGMPLGSLM